MTTPKSGNFLGELAQDKSAATIDALKLRSVEENHTE